MTEKAKGLLTRLQHRIYEHPWAATALLLGIGIGIVVSQPIFPYTLPDSSAQLIGSFLGAAIAVTGAIWAASIKDRKFRADLRLATVVVYEPFINALSERMAGVVLLNGQTTPLDDISVEAIRSSKRMSEVTRSSLEDLRPAFSQTPNDYIVYRHLIGAMDRFVSAFDAELSRDESRRLRQAQDRQSHFNHPSLPRTIPEAVDTSDFEKAIRNAKSVMDTVGR